MPSRMQNRFSFRRPTWRSSTCSRRIRRKRSKRSASGLNTRPQRSPTRGNPKENRDENECERLRSDCPTVLHCLRCPRRRWHARSLRGWRTRTICSVWPRERRANPWWHRCYLARVSECRSELPSQSDRADPCGGEHSGDPSRDERAHTCRSAWGCKEGQDVHIPHRYILRFEISSKITRLSRITRSVATP